MYRIVKFIIRLILRRHSIEGIENITDDDVAVFVCNHDDKYGPLAMAIFFPLKFRPWVIYRIMTAGLCRKQLENSLFGRYNQTFRPLYRLLARICEPACLWIMRKAEAIPVYRGDNRIFTTFRMSVEALKEGYNIVLFPEKDEPDSHGSLKDFYTGFAHIARQYYNENGRQLLFYPVYADRYKRRITVGKPTAYDPAVTFGYERARLANIMKEAIERYSVHS